MGKDNTNERMQYKFPIPNSAYLAGRGEELRTSQKPAVLSFNIYVIWTLECLFTKDSFFLPSCK